MTQIKGRRFAHEPIFCVHRGKVKVYCSCGAQSPLFSGADDQGIRDVERAYTDAQESYTNHVGLKEMQQKKLVF